MSVIGRVGDYFRNSQVWGSIFRHGIPRDRRTRAMAPAIKSPAMAMFPRATAAEPSP